MKLEKVIRDRIRQRLRGVELEADVNAAVAANVGERGRTTAVSSTSTASAGRREQGEPDRPET